MQTKTAYVGLAAALVAAVFFGVTQFRQDDAAPAKLRDDPNLFSFVRSMEGSVPDGEIKADGDALVVDTELRLLYDYFLTAVGEKTVDEIRAEIEREIDKRLKSAPAAEAKRLLARYLDYKRELVEVEKNAQLAGPSLAAMRARIEAMHRTRAKFFSGREAEGLFGADDTYDADALARLEVLQDKSLTDAQKKEKIAALDAALPAEVREAK
ncbi:MAG: lipase secretion chaperone, partial [Noviherbaspirillum sp.]